MKYKILKLWCTKWITLENITDDDLNGICDQLNGELWEKERGQNE